MHLHGMQRGCCTVLLLFLLSVVVQVPCSAVYGEEPDWRTRTHEKGVCATYGICGHRKDGDVLNCANNTEAQPVSDAAARKLQDVCPQLVAETNGKFCCTEEQIDTLSQQIQIAGIFLVGCPACNQNFKHFFCTLTCSPDQSTFTNVSEIQKASDNNKTVVEELDIFVADSYGKQFYDSCKDVVYAAANMKAMSFIGGGAKNFQEFFEFLGMVKDKRVPPAGSPFQMNFPGEAQTPQGMLAANESVPACWESALKCSCGDCPDGPQCSPPPAPPPPPVTGCTAVGMAPDSISCQDVSLILLYIVLVPVLALCIRYKTLHSCGEPLTFRNMLGLAAASQRSNMWAEELAAAADAERDAEEEPPKSLGTGLQYSLVEKWLRSWYFEQGQRCARHPWRVLGFAVLAVLICSLGMLRFRVETDPQRLWVGPTSLAATEKAAYEESFGAFYRIEQLILSTTPKAASQYIAQSGLPSIVTDENIKLLFRMQAEVDALEVSVGDSNATATLQDVCYKPFGAACATQSILQFWKMDEDIYEKGEPPYGMKLSPDFCFSHWSTQCRSTFEAPMDPHVILGGFPNGPDFRNFSADSTAFVVTFPVDSSSGNRCSLPLAWEAEFIELARTKLTQMADEAGLRLSFSAERSVTDELARESYADVSTVAISYVVMLAYIALALGYYPRGASPLAVLVTGRVSLGLGGVLIVAGAVAGALGLCSLFGMWSTLIIMEVIPFLVLAVGVDNMFILANELDRTDASLPLPERLGRTLAAAGPSISLAATAEVVAFGLGAFSTMPAVRNFSICAALAVLLDFCLQVTAFVALLALDAQRIREGRLDVAPCIQLPPKYLGAAADGHNGHGSSEEPLLALQRYMAEVHAPLLLKPAVQGVVLAVFLGLFLLCCGALPHISKGLEQETALPRDSFLQPYYKDVYEYLRVGPPLLLVVNNLNMTRSSGDINAVCSISGCNDSSLLNQVANAARTPQQTYIAAPAASWLDDFLSWISPQIPRCCRATSDGAYCPPPDQPPCSVNASACADCAVCFRASGPPGPDFLSDGRPTLHQVKERLPWFLKALPSEDCAKGGAGAYNGALQLSSKDYGVVEASSFRTSYVPLNKQEDFINGMQARPPLPAALLPYNASRALPQMYSFSIFHVFFEQYLTIGHDALVLLTFATLAVTAVVYAFTASLWASALICIVLVMILVDLLGVMVVWGIQLNAVSLVNLTMALGISVEFCAHLVHAYVVAPGSRPARTATALVEVGASVLSGITLTKFVGVMVLAFAKTKIFEVYYFRVYMALVVLGAAHSLILLPVLLALAGPPALPEKPRPFDVRS
ncbi:multidrug efflux transporter AcrB transmembrane domain-containing protein [Coccomyxa subellipsoidea C-169]|uniref:Multidrug efflux transporter AcrB transmembrane domain-containing protein n=1 Tax=Coccomyxa subellipsoidea (strain C-169) TaxID=574566 RepID=I0Z7Q3_COCSC|nr:multidrug efflux transporter AcrB transmembrane domain-containing protein [Coccomyxa subellipsoidea C-169]EIE26672.1 multidrug efflux transporter AcrB transmembrane domain-containing protein [Coccomyxa subellipsoidea C-169]|eukprot:XP_005651216.1 multidrug efflux transporter AcrB transmembrane domain-containing protein [Coccomyxa subellipsoidea C-169]